MTDVLWLVGLIKVKPIRPKSFFCLTMNFLGSTYTLCTFLFCFQSNRCRDGERVWWQLSTASSTSSSNHKKRSTWTPRSSLSCSPTIIYMEQSGSDQTIRGCQPNVCIKCRTKQSIKWKVSFSLLNIWVWEQT